MREQKRQQELQKIKHEETSFEVKMFCLESRKSLKLQNKLYKEYINWKLTDITRIKGSVLLIDSLSNIHKKKLTAAFNQVLTFPAEMEKHRQKQNRIKKERIMKGKIYILSNTLQNINNQMKKSAFKKLHRNQKVFTGLKKMCKWFSIFCFKNSWKKIVSNSPQLSFSYTSSICLEIEEEIRKVQREIEEEKEKGGNKKSSDFLNTKIQKGYSIDQSQFLILDRNEKESLDESGCNLIEEYMSRYEKLQVKADEIREQCQAMINTSTLHKNQIGILQEIIKILIPPQALN